ncbi:hypothetical protein BC827DRAFT_67909 [Russula dissimulans]|nr:hypothetical protein BC827DRAFT_67909 [Russula dissimulans]
MTSIAPGPHPTDAHSVADHLPPHPSKSLLASTWQVLDQPPPPTLREILGAYRSRGDGDREMLIAMLHAKSAEDQRIASVASLHRSLLEYYQISSRQMQEAPYPPVSDPTGVPFSNAADQSPLSSPAPIPHLPHHQNDGPSRRPAPAHPHKRVRTSESPPSTYRSVPSSFTPSPPPRASSAYSSRSGSVDHSPHARDAMAIGSLLTMGAQQPRDDVKDPNAMYEDRLKYRR